MTRAAGLARGLWPQGRPMGAAVLLLLVWLAWPPLSEGVLFPDSFEYLRWPEPVKTGGVDRLGARFPAYSILLQNIGTGAALVHLQTWLSLSGFALLGFVLARWPGMLLGGLLSLAPELGFWRLVALTESLSFALLAWIMALGLLLARRWTRPVFASWCVAVVFFGLMRSSNIAVLPFVLAPFVLQLHDLEHFSPFRRGLRPSWPRFAAAAVLALCVFVAGTVLSERSEFWRMNYHTVMLERIVTDAEARDYFRAAGLPAPVRWKSDEFASWFDAHARTTYQSWVFGRWQSYATAWRWLVPAGQREELQRKYVEPAQIEAATTGAAELGEWIYRALAPPQLLWALIVVAALLADLRSGRLEVLALSSFTLALGAYAQCFAAYHGSAAEEMRHTLAASLMYRFSFALGLCALYGSLRSLRSGMK